ncbi:MAG TPA: asparaginase [Hyphomicrobiaceae bacterium]|nr:asparaginase [Hyphomicrobiaceae bacterium]
MPLIAVTRGQRLESLHRGALAIADCDGNIIASVGDITEPVFPRSAIKALQALPLVASGAAEHFGFSRTELALACSSHAGEPRHARAAAAILGRLGLTVDALTCGPHLPLGIAAAHDMLRHHDTPTRLHNNCSGKHVGMLATALHLKEPLAHYEAKDHPVQDRIRTLLEALTGVKLGDNGLGIDGCSLPNWAVPLGGLATAFARFISEGDGLHGDVAATYNPAMARLAAACWAAPEYVAGLNRLDSEMLARFPGEVFVKGGAEGVYCGGIKSRGLGFALKIEDGAKRGAEAAVKALIAHLVAGADDLALPEPILNWDGRATGETRLTPEFETFLATLKPN